jgi:lipopolysaccharide/colanic/teichoic acid biosynthesis glycosyltransferase
MTTLIADPRITPIGAFLRRTHIDEIPQLWNVFVGEMSLIGPRPEQPALVEQYGAALPAYNDRHLVKPGLSGWSQVCYGYASDLEETNIKLQYDLYYLHNFGLWLDMRIALRTILIFLNRRYVR